MFGMRHGVKKRKPGFVEKTLGDITHNLEQAIFTEENARRPGFMQSIDPRLKVVISAALLVATGLAHNASTIALLYLFTLSLAIMSRIPLNLFVKRVWLGIPFFAGIVVLPSLFLVPGVPILTLVVPGTLVAITISSQALAGAVLFVARVGTSVSVATLLVLTTPWTDLLKALSILRVPDAFVLILGMTYRYIFLFLRQLDNMLLSRQSRTVGDTSRDRQRRWIVASIGTLLGKSFEMSTEVYQAMLSRGFSGRVRTFTDYRMEARDWALATLTFGLTVALLLLDRSLIR